MIVLAAAAALLLWVVAGPGNAGADEFKRNANGDFAATNFGFGVPQVDVFRGFNDNNGKNQATFVSYDNSLGLGGGFGFGQVPNGDYKGSGNNHRLNTDTSRFTGGTIFGPGGPIKVSFVGDGNVFSKITGKNVLFGFGGHEVTLKGQESSESAIVNGTSVGFAITNQAGTIGKRRGIIEQIHVP